MALQPAAQPLAIYGSSDVATLYRNFVEGFENAFVICNNGTLKNDKHHRKLVQDWFNKHKLMIMLITGVDVPDLEFGAHRGGIYGGDFATTNANKKTVLYCYGLSLAAYLKYCQTLQREIDRRFKYKLDVEEVGSDEDEAD